MAKRGIGTGSARSGKAAPVTGATTIDTIEQRLVTLAGQLGRLAGTVQSKADDWLDKDALTAQMVSVRDSAAELLTHLTADATKASKTLLKKPTVKKAVKAIRKATGTKTSAKRTAKTPAKPAAKTPAGTTSRDAGTGRSGGVVDAPGKKHRKPLPSDPGASLVDSQAAKLRTAMPMAKTPRFRGRG